ncbi:hypothetical protein ABW19_dt0209439 [Dactylella cylindrospora]|nr:hypothetical protein ABW19_dt0209439 [Dactylella cylindrospora]
MAIASDTLKKPLVLFALALLIFVVHEVVFTDVALWSSTLPEFQDDLATDELNTVNPIVAELPTGSPTSTSTLGLPSLLDYEATQSNNETESQSLDTTLSDKANDDNQDNLEKEASLDDLEDSPSPTETKEAEPPLRTLSHEELQKLISDAVKDALEPYAVMLKDCKKSQGLG